MDFREEFGAGRVVLGYAAIVAPQNMRTCTSQSYGAAWRPSTVRSPRPPDGPSVDLEELDSECAAGVAPTKSRE